MKRHLVKGLLIVFFPVTIVILFCIGISLLAEAVLDDAFGWRKS